MPHHAVRQPDPGPPADLQMLAAALERAAVALQNAARETERAALLVARNLERRSDSEVRLLTIGEAARFLSLSRSKLYAYVLGGDIPSITLGRSRRIPAAALADWIERQRAERS